MVSFHEHIITDLLEDPTGGLVILSAGLSLSKLISSLLILHDPVSGPLLLLNSPSSLSPSLQSITSDLPLSKRLSLYASGLPLSVTSRILVVDLLTGRLLPANVAGIVIVNAHNVGESSTEAFIVRLLRNGNRDICVWAFSDRAQAMVAGFAKTERIMKCLYLKKLHLWPRFQVSIPLPPNPHLRSPLHKHLSLYASGLPLSVTSRIPVVDLLTSRLLPTNVAGIVIVNAHNVGESSTDAFIVRLLRNGRDICVWAFSDRAQAMVAGFAKTERIMKCLYLKKLHLWPLFQVYVSQDLERDPPEVVDVRVPISPHMKVIQRAVIEVMDACLKEMRKTNKVDVDDLTVENGLFKSFDEIVRRQLDPIWHTLGKKTKQLVSDLKTLRKLLDYLVRYDAVTYLKYLDSLRASESFRSVWIFAESSYKIFEYAKRRVYQFKRLDGEDLAAKNKASKTTKKRKAESGQRKEDSLSSTSASEVVLEEVLEEAPKWKVLRDVLQEIEEERQKQALVRAEQSDECEEDNGIVLVVCKDEYSCMQLEDCISKGPQKVMREEWEKYLLSKVELRNASKNNKKKAKGPKGFGVLDGVSPIVHAQREESGVVNQEQKALLAAAAKITKKVEHNIIEDVQPCVGAHAKKKGKKREGNDNTEIFMSETNEPPIFNQSVLQRHSVGVDATTSKDNKILPPVCFYALEREQDILGILKPSTVVVYHPEMAFVREIEIYKSENPSKQVKVYFLFYEESTEVQKFESSIRRENGAFESLIRQKSLMMIPVDQDGRCLGPSSIIDPQPSTLQNSMTRKAGGRKEAEKETRIIVDMREFMSSLPNVLHQKGMRILPVTLEVGDYILSPLICIERKSIQDLFGSFASGRLFNQAEMMSRYYQMPVLLIEFSQDKSFSFLSASDIGDDVTPNSIISKLCLLVLHFPRLRIVWSRSLHATAEIFANLKANQDEPDEVKAIRVGVPSEEGIVENDVRAENYNTSAVEFLRRLPGVTDSNYRAIMDNCESLADLALLPLEKLAELMGGQKSAKTLRDFLDAKYPTLL